MQYRSKLSLGVLLGVVALFLIDPVLAQSSTGGLDRINTFMDNILALLRGISVTVATIAIIWAGYKFLYQHADLSEIVYILGGGLLVGAAAEIARYLLGSKHMIRRDPLFKGCTRPPMLFGVPLAPLILVTVVHAMLAIWFTLLFLVGLPVAVVIMRLIVHADEQRFRQLALWLRFRLRDGNRHFWGGCTSYSLLDTSRRRW